ncbi:MAG: cysteine hydrolase family protein [Terriglobales bacterium]
MADTALIVVDMFNPYRHADAEDLAASVGRIIEPLADIVRRGRERDDIDLIYVNDNYGDFTTDRDQIVRQAFEGERGDLVSPIAPTRECTFLPKVRHSAFYSTSLDYLLRRLGTSRVILAGQVTEQCILYSALDAYIRHFDVRLPTDAVAHIDPDLGAAALEMMQRNMRAELLSAEDCLD